jgi:hypothetical protein
VYSTLILIQSGVFFSGDFIAYNTKIKGQC